MKLIIVYLIFLCSTVAIFSQENTSSFNAGDIAAIFISNVNGSVEVNGHNNDEVEVNTSAYKIKDGYKLHQFMYNDTLVIVMEDKHFTVQDCDSDYPFPSNIRQRNCNRSYSPDVLYITVSAPRSMLIKASTVNEGDIIISNVTKDVTAKNINGSISLDQVVGVHEAHTINGDVDVEFANQPTISGKYYSLNGNLNIYVPNTFDAELTFKSFNGDFYTNIDDIKLKASKIEKIDSDRKFHIKADKKSYMTVGDGGIVMELETFNGDAIIKKIEN